MKFMMSSSNLQYVKFGISSSSLCEVEDCSSSLCEVWDKFKQFM